MLFSKNRLKRLFMTLWNFGYTRSFSLARLLAKQSVRLPEFQFNRQRSTVTSPDLKSEFHVQTHFHFLPDLRILEKIVLLAGGQLTPRPDGTLEIQVQGIQLVASGPEQVAIVQELFVNGIYNLGLPTKAVAIDIGMNVGLTSLFLASNSKIERIYSFEPFLETFQYGLKNIALNPGLSHKIEPQRVAIADKNGELSVDYSPQWRNNNSIVSSELRSTAGLASQTRSERIQLRRATEVIQSVISRHQEAALVLKVDCEGSEYSIFEDLKQAGLLRKVHIVMLEWHKRGPGPLEKILTDEGFATFSFEPTHPQAGMSYAVRLTAPTDLGKN